MKKEIKYIGFYDLSKTENKRVSNIAATNKMDYICDAINRAGFDVHIVSPSWFDDSANELKYESKKTIYLSCQKRITFCPTYRTKLKWSRNLKIVLTLIWLFIWLIIHVHRNEKILVYHVQWLSIPIRLAKRIKGFGLILEVEEFYGDIYSIRPYFDVLEKKIFAAADSYLFSTELLAERIASKYTPYIVIYGVYNNYPKFSTPQADGKIHLLYAGIIDTYKAGAFIAVECTKFLSSSYILHIIGFGEIEKLQKRIDDLNLTNECKIIFDGSKSGDDYIKYVQKCHIGLSTQKMDGKYLGTSFPSKILSYLSLGIRTISCNIDCVTKSKVNDLMYYYEVDEPQAIANAILSVDLNDGFSSRECIQKLDEEFVLKVEILLNK
jgi:hypothetical protein